MGPLLAIPEIAIAVEGAADAGAVAGEAGEAGAAGEAADDIAAGPAEDDAVGRRIQQFGNFTTAAMPWATLAQQMAAERDMEHQANTAQRSDAEMFEDAYNDREARQLHQRYKDIRAEDPEEEDAPPEESLAHFVPPGVIAPPNSARYAQTAATHYAQYAHSPPLLAAEMAANPQLFTGGTGAYVSRHVLRQATRDLNKRMPQRNRVRSYY